MPDIETIEIVKKLRMTRKGQIMYIINKLTKILEDNTRDINDLET